MLQQDFSALYQRLRTIRWMGLQLSDTHPGRGAADATR